MAFKNTKDFVKDTLEFAAKELFGFSFADESYVNRSEFHSKGESGSTTRQVPTDTSFSDLPSATVFIKKKQWSNFSEHWYYDVPFGSQGVANQDLINALSVLICSKLTDLARHEAFSKVRDELSSLDQLTKTAQTNRITIDEEGKGGLWSKVGDIVTNMFELLSPQVAEEDSMFSCWYTIEGLNIEALRSLNEEIVSLKKKLKETVAIRRTPTSTIIVILAAKKTEEEIKAKIADKEKQLNKRIDDQVGKVGNRITRMIASDKVEDKMAFNGVIELANVSSINTSTSLYGKGSATLDIIAPEDIFNITENDILKAYSEMIAGTVLNDKDLIRTWIKSSAGPIVRANDSIKENNNIIYINTVTGAIFKELKSGENPLPITDSEKAAVDIAYDEERAVPYVLQTMKENFQGKAIIEPRDQVYVWFSTPSGNPQIEKSFEFDKKVNAEVAGREKISRDQITKIFLESLDKIEKNPYNDLVKLHEIIDRNNGEVQVFQGVVKEVKSSYSAESGEHRLSLSCVDNMDWLSLATQIEIPGLRDPRLKVNWPVVSQDNAPLAWKSSKIVMQADNAAFDSALGFENQKITIVDPNASEKGKTVVIDLSKQGIAPPILFEKLFAGVDAANVICTLVTGFPYSEDLLTRTAADIGEYKMDPTGRAVDENAKKMIAEIAEGLDLDEEASLQALRDPIFNTIKQQARVQNRFLGDFVPIIDLSFMNVNELDRSLLEKRTDEKVSSEFHRIIQGKDGKRELARVEELIKEEINLEMDFGSVSIPFAMGDRETANGIVRSWLILNNWTMIKEDFSKPAIPVMIYAKVYRKIADRLFLTIKNRYALKQSLKSEVMVFGLPLYIQDLSTEAEQIKANKDKIKKREVYRDQVFEDRLSKDDQFLKKMFAKLHDNNGNLKYYKEKQNIRRNIDRNFLKISPRYQDAQVEAYNRMLSTTDFPLWQTDYTTVERTCKEIAQTIDFEFYADPQGNLSFTPPRYNRTPVDLLTFNLLTPSREYFFEEVFFGGLIDVIEKLDGKKREETDLEGELLLAESEALAKGHTILAHRGAHSSIERKVDSLRAQLENPSTPGEELDDLLEELLINEAALRASTKSIGIYDAPVFNIKKLKSDIAQLGREIEELEKTRESKVLENTLLNYTINPVFTYRIEDYDILGWALQEGEPDFTRLDVSGAPDYADLSQSIETYYMAFGVHYQLWRTYGYKFESIHKKFIHSGEQASRYGEILLAEQEGKVFSGSITKRGDSKHQSGDVIYIVSRNMLYYVAGVQHSFNYGKSYTTSLTLQYGRRPGTYIPHPFDSLGSYVLRADSNENDIDQKIRDEARIRYYHTEFNLGIIVRDVKYNEAKANASQMAKRGAKFFFDLIIEGDPMNEKASTMEVLLKAVDEENMDTSKVMLRSGFEKLIIEIKARLNEQEEYKEEVSETKLKELMEQRQALVRKYLEAIIDKNNIENGRIEIKDSNDFDYFRQARGKPGSTLRLSWLPTTQ